MHTIHKEKAYLLVTLEGEATYHVFKNAIEEVMARDDYHTMNDIWQLDNCVLLVRQDQLQDIVDEILRKYPQQASRTKTAIVAASGVSRAIVQFWAELANNLPYEIQIFMSLPEAETWLA